MPDTLESRRTKRGAQGYGGRNGNAAYARSTTFPVYTEPEPTRWPRPPKGEGEAARNNVVMSAGKRSSPDLSVICLISVTLPTDFFLTQTTRHLDCNRLSVMVVIFRVHHKNSEPQLFA